MTEAYLDCQSRSSKLVNAEVSLGSNRGFQDSWKLNELAIHSGGCSVEIVQAFIKELGPYSPSMGIICPIQWVPFLCSAFRLWHNF